ncbi:hypothetical protein E1B28_008153 [Marasmius oreades]|uniref:Zn(2)-C6 fungal-type domain-containing protein n=1 Tax=Marasmius oreades TaxID=181124 RepID=A0A9P7RXY9_9AGAR|nr:uncharacterized protein E1B28_008153 [Marasmius oreades]KAG7091752.1 hypothetical protein E1B28_008153 [Marasmius oreades]
MGEVGRICSRPIQSCFQCRRRKIKCNRTYPCAPCILRGEGDVCREVDRSNIASSGKTSAETLAEVNTRVSILEKTVAHFSKFLPKEEEESPSSLFTPLPEDSERELAFTSIDSNSVTRANSPASSSSSSSTAVSPTLPVENDTFKGTSLSGIAKGYLSTDEETARMLEDVALGWRINRHRAAQDLEPRAAFSPSHKPHTSETDVASQNDGLSIDHPLSLIIGSSTNALHNIFALLPGEIQSRTLVENYFQNIEWYTKTFHYPSFMANVNRLLDRTRPVPFPIKEVDQDILAFLPVYLMVLCLSFYLIEPDQYRSLGVASQDTDTLQMAKKMYNAAHACLLLQDYLAHHTLETVQCLILMGVYQQNTGDSDSQWALLGTAIKMAQNLGMSQLPPESASQAYPAMWQSVVKREVARRVWWNLVFSDWSQASTHSGLYSIHPHQTHTSLPANLNDADLIEGKPVQGKPKNQYTEMTFSLTRFRFINTHRQSIDHMMKPSLMGWSFIKDTDAELRQLLEQVPMSFEMTNKIGKKLEKGKKSLEILFVMVMGLTWRMRLHRPFLSRGYTDCRFEKSKEECISSAKSILNYFKSYPEHFEQLLRWRTVMSYGFAAVVVLFMDLCHHKQTDPSSIEGRRNEFEEASAVLRSGIAKCKSGLSQDSLRLMERMIKACSAPTSISESSKKRATPDSESDESFERMAKKILFSPNPSQSTHTPSFLRWGVEQDADKRLFTTPHQTPAPTPNLGYFDFRLKSSSSLTTTTSTNSSLPTDSFIKYRLPTPPYLESNMNTPPSSESAAAGVVAAGDSTSLQFELDWNMDVMLQQNPVLDINSSAWPFGDLQMMGLGVGDSTPPSFDFDF